MRRIQKSREPRSLIALRKQGGVFEDLSKDEVRPLLIADQRRLCCYCMDRLEDGALTVKVEHFRCQQRHPTLVLVWSNLFAACTGGQGQPPSLQHCDTRKGNQDCDLDPLSLREEDISYGSDGTIHHTDPELDRQLNDELDGHKVKPS